MLILSVSVLILVPLNDVMVVHRLMKKALEDPSDLLRKKRNMPINDLGVWKLNNRVRKEQVFHEPLVSGE